MYSPTSIALFPVFTGMSVDYLFQLINRHDTVLLPMDHPMTVRTEADHISSRVRDGFLVQAVQRLDMVDFNKAFTDVTIAFCEIESTCGAFAPVNTDCRIPVLSLTLIFRGVIPTSI